MDKQTDTSTWLKFFKDAGIPTKTGASYALIFVENRIHKNMLSDLSVDYLRLMGITLMGDIIAILRHSKSVHQDSLRKVVILQSKEETPSKQSYKVSRSSSSSSESSDDDVEMVEITKPTIKNTLASSTRIGDKHPKKETPPSVSHTEPKQIKSKVIGKMSSSKLPQVNEKKPIQPVKRNYISENEHMEESEPVAVKPNANAKTGKSILKELASSAKKIRVTAENDIIGPKLPPPKKTVFERLGAESEPPLVSSTTELVKPVTVETKFTRTISSISLPIKSVNIIAGKDSSPRKISSVFDRLGGVKEEIPPQVQTSKTALPYAGVLKSPPVETRKLLNPLKRIRTMRADEPDVPAKLRAAAKPSVDRNMKTRVDECSIRNRLQPPIKLTKAGLQRERKPNTGSQGIFANSEKSTNVSVKQRLGLSLSSGKVSSTTSINQKIRRQPFPIDLGYKDYQDDEEDDTYVFPSQVKLTESKKVSFGRVERKFISPAKTPRGQRFMEIDTKTKTSVHSRLGLPK